MAEARPSSCVESLGAAFWGLSLGLWSRHAASPVLLVHVAHVITCSYNTQ